MNKSTKVCKKCKQNIVGEGTVLDPYHCDCGIWKFNTFVGRWQYTENDYGMGIGRFGA